MGDLLAKLKNYNDVFIFGCGNVGRHIYNQLIDDNVSANVHFCDNFRHGSAHLGAEILSPEDAFHKHPDALFIVGSGLHYMPMLTQLREMGVPDNNIVAEWVETKSRMTARSYIDSVQYHLVEHCNLRCAGCLHFANVAEESFADIDVFQETFKRFFDLMGDSYRGGIVFLGGEPLLHPQIERFIKCARELTSTGTIFILTNGILLTKMPESFWETCASCRVHIGISGYPINLDDSEIKRLAAKHSVGLSISSRDNSAWLQYVFDLDGNQNIERSFTSCENANECYIIKGRNLYNCSVTACIEHFNTAFGKNLTLQSEDYLDLFSDISARDILNYISTPTPFCRYCNREKLKLGQTWGPSNRGIGEYLE